jgi:hypothetical protein
VADCCLTAEVTYFSLGRLVFYFSLTVRHRQQIGDNLFGNVFRWKKSVNLPWILGGAVGENGIFDPELSYAHPLRNSNRLMMNNKVTYPWLQSRYCINSITCIC